MTVRYAFFEGTIHPGREAEFRSIVHERLIPLWTKFPGCQNVTVSFEVEHDDGVPSCPLVLSFHYPDLATLHMSLQSEVRTVSRGVTAELLKLFNGRVRHHICEPAQGAGAQHAFEGVANLAV